MAKKKASRRNQKLYKMKGCYKTRKNYLGGDNLAYTGKPIPSVSNPFLAYTGKGGSVFDKAYPSIDPVPINGTIFNNASPQLGGNCSTCSSILPIPSLLNGGRRRKRQSKTRKMNGGNGNAYPNGLVGSPWTPTIGGWPGVGGIPGNNNYYSNNTYNNDISRQMVDVGANKPFLNLNGGKSKKGNKGKKKLQKGGSLSNFIGQDLLNLGRQFNFGVGSAYNALAGYSSPINPLPWKDQFPTKIPFNPSTI